MHSIHATWAPFHPHDNVHPGHMIGGFEVMEQDRPVGIQTLNSRYESALAAMEETKKRRKEVKERRRIKALGRGEIPGGTGSSLFGDNHILDSYNF
jgi:hypothetical protein